MKKPECLSPAGSIKNLKYALAYGADAVYAGQPRYSLRVRNNEFTLEKLAQAREITRTLQRKLYVVNNIAPHNSKLNTFLTDLAPVAALKPDAMIMSDPGVIMLTREHFPDLPIHLSVQANTVNWASVQFWQQQGIKRIILSRELGLNEIAEIRQRCPDIELEVFVHGALCMAYSGRCLLSGYINKRDANQGACTNACRWQYRAAPAKEDGVGQFVPEPTLGYGAPTEQAYLLQEPQKPDELMPAFEDEHGTYIMNSRDLRAVEHVHKLVEIGVDSLKIEGRTKSFYYCARTAQVYRQAIDDAVSGKPFDPALSDQLSHLANRGYTEGFLNRHRHDAYQQYDRGESKSESRQLVGEVTGDSTKGLLVAVKNRFEVGDTLEIMTPAHNYIERVTALYSENETAISVAPGSGYNVILPVSAKIDAAYGIVTRVLPS
ncbi:tRNA 5-hydroxyuridine modification protein YegQ [Alteromonas sp. 14N.309.X.WAT.G.H12]|uniref:prephenate-dependent tRNA uridine(34) hydroxylase TrhP n=1 Tax=Alteromonas sp. 14N.309.X.WAT.G.H12 TaxID=3120824 RepID=UPI002FD52E8C